MAAAIPEVGLLAVEGIAELTGGAAARAGVEKATGGFLGKLGKFIPGGSDILNIATLGMMTMPPEHHDTPVPINPPPPPAAKPPDPPLPTPTVAKLAPIPPPPPAPLPPKAPVYFSASDGGAGSNEPQRVHNESHESISAMPVCHTSTNDDARSPVVMFVVLGGGALVLFYLFYLFHKPTVTQ